MTNTTLPREPLAAADVRRLARAHGRFLDVVEDVATANGLDPQHVYQAAVSGKLAGVRS